MSLFLIHFTGNKMNSSAYGHAVGHAAKTLAQSLTALTGLQTLDLSGIAFCIFFYLPFLM